jgi:hypothetical protein
MDMGGLQELILMLLLGAILLGAVCLVAAAIGARNAEQAAHRWLATGTGFLVGLVSSLSWALSANSVVWLLTAYPLGAGLAFITARAFGNLADPGGEPEKKHVEIP